MWTAHWTPVNPRTKKATIDQDARTLAFRDVIELWQTSELFREFFTATLAGCSFEAFFWETPAVTERTLGRAFEFVCVEGLPLTRLEPDPEPFAEHFSSSPSEAVVTFPNLRGDAILVVPAPVADETCYPHLAQFLRHAPQEQVDAFWRATGLAMKKRVSNAPTWLSTAGMGVSWLHLRLDSRPKYYRFRPYAAEPG